MGYILLYGFRRFSACKKLGWKTIHCYIKELDKSMDLEIDKIDILEENTRLHQNDETFNELMQSIKENGLLHPIGVSNNERLAKEDFITLNLIENIHRENISPSELSRAIHRLKDEGLTIGQIAVRLGQPKHRIQSISHMAKDMKSALDQSVFVGEHKTKRKGMLPYAAVSKISGFRASSEDRKKLLQFAKDGELTLNQIDLVIKLYFSGMSIEEAVKKLDMYQSCIVQVIFKNKEIEKRDLAGGTRQKLILSILKKAEPKLFYFSG